MGTRLNDLLREIRALELDVQDELKRREETLKYKIRKRRVVFEEEIGELHKKMSSSILPYLMRASLLNVMSAPVIYAIMIPAIALDMGLWLYQAVCMPIYGIPGVKRDDHIMYERHYLKYLNRIERLNCDCCSYFNGLMSYASEIAARTEQYWCPIKHASSKAFRHSRYHLFLDYGDAEAYNTKLSGLRKKYEDIQ